VNELAAGRPARPAWPYLLLLAYVVVLYVRPQEYVPALMETPLVPALLASTFLAWLFTYPKQFEASQHRLMLALTGVIFVSDALPDGLGGAIAGTMDFVPTVLLFYVVATSVDSVARFRWLMLAIVGVTGLIALHGIQQDASDDGIGWTGAAMVDGRITYIGFLNDPNDLSMAFLMALPLTIWVALTEKWKLMRWAAWAVVALTLWATYLCNSRGSILGVLAMAVMFAVRRFGWLRSLVVLPVLLVPMLLLAPSRISEMSADEESAEGRIDAWYEAFEMLREHPVFGVGKGLFVDHNYLTAHNSFVLAIAELGIVGYFVWLANLLLTGMMLVRLVKASVPPSEDAAPEAGAADESWATLHGMAVALAYSMLGTLVAAFFLSRSYVNILYLLIATVVSVYGMARARWPDRFDRVWLSDMAGTVFGIEIGSIVFLWVLTRVLLSMQ
jgi:O-antigen ligase